MWNIKRTSEALLHEESPIGNDDLLAEYLLDTPQQWQPQMRLLNEYSPMIEIINPPMSLWAQAFRNNLNLYQYNLSLRIKLFFS